MLSLGDGRLRRFRGPFDGLVCLREIILVHLRLRRLLLRVRRWDGGRRGRDGRRRRLRKRRRWFREVGNRNGGKIEQIDESDEIVATYPLVDMLV